MRILKEGEILFQTGEQATSMYIVRRGALKVYFIKDNEEVQLAVLNDGAIVGEMAFFDQKPRSAHVKALTQTEINEISKADFDKLLTQVPQWLFKMMQSLSGRLRTTNEKLAGIEQAQQDSSLAVIANFPLIPIVRSLRIVQLLMHEIGEKDGSNINLDLQSTLDWWMSLTGWPKAYFERFVASMEKQGLLNKRSDGGKPPRLVVTSRARLSLMTEFLLRLQPRATAESIQGFSPTWTALLDAVIAEAGSSGYEAYNVPVSTLPTSYSGLPSNAKERLQIAEFLAQWLQLKVTKNNNEVLIRISPKEHKNSSLFLKMLHDLLADRLHLVV